MAALGGILVSVLGSLAGPLALYLLKAWIERKGLSDDALKAYYSFMEALDKHSGVDVSNFLAAGTARAEVIERLKAARLAREEAAKNGTN